MKLHEIDDELLKDLIAYCEQKMTSPFKKKEEEKPEVSVAVIEDKEDESESESDISEKGFGVKEESSLSDEEKKKLLEFYLKK